MNNLLFIAGGGAIGSVFRFWMSTLVQNILGKDIPYGTLSVNLLGSILIGLLSVILQDKPEWRLLLIVGLLGGFTTFSAFSLETVQLLQNGQAGKALLNVLLSVSLCLLGCWFGIITGKRI